MRANTEVEYPPVIFSPISPAVPPGLMAKTRRPPFASSTTLPGTCASMVTARSMQIAEPVHMSVIKLYVPAATKILSTALLPTARVSSATELTVTSFKCRPCSMRGTTSKGVTGPEGLLWTIEVLGTIVDSTPGDLGALGGPLLCARLDAPQQPNAAWKMRHLTWSRARFDDALLPRDTVDERHECAQPLNDSKLAAPARTATPPKYVAAV